MNFQSARRSEDRDDVIQEPRVLRRCRRAERDKGLSGLRTAYLVQTHALNKAGVEIAVVPHPVEPFGVLPLYFHPKDEVQDANDADLHRRVMVLWHGLLPPNAQIGLSSDFLRLFQSFENVRCIAEF
jgi:hypothetical protein